MSDSPLVSADEARGVITSASGTPPGGHRPAPVLHREAELARAMGRRAS
ncbi:hypothetical protein OG379_37835 [Streptomyces sp. NBC_01166]|nr:hypothetical protein OG379_37835 [Streptomyces sp. NBC_01166]